MSDEICQENMKMIVDSRRCKGCGLCTFVCPKKIVEIEKEERNDKGYFYAKCIEQNQCISCTRCAIMCPDSAIPIKK